MRQRFTCIRVLGRAKNGHQWELPNIRNTPSHLMAPSNECMIRFYVVNDQSATTFSCAFTDLRKNLLQLWSTNGLVTNFNEACVPDLDLMASIITRTLQKYNVEELSANTEILNSQSTFKL